MQQEILEAIRVWCNHPPVATRGGLAMAVYKASMILTGWPIEFSTADVHLCQLYSSARSKIFLQLAARRSFDRLIMDL